MYHHSFPAKRTPNGPSVGCRMPLSVDSGLVLSRRSLLRQLGVAGASLAAAPALASELIELPLPSEPRQRPLTHAVPGEVGHDSAAEPPAAA